jgi:serine/threonine protein kinase
MWRFFGHKLTLIFVAYHALVEKGILHRDISENNVMINLIGDSGLLIDLDMAKDLLEAEDVSKLLSSILRIFPVREPADQPADHRHNSTQTVPIASTPSATSGIAHTQGASLEQDPGNKLNQNGGVRDPITVCSYHETVPALLITVRVPCLFYPYLLGVILSAGSGKTWSLSSGS